MRRQFAIGSLLVLVTVATTPALGQRFFETSTVGGLAGEPTLAGNPTIGVCYSPGYLSSDCVSLIVYWVGRANSTVHIFTYSLTSPNITQALIQAAARHVDVKIAMGMIQAGSKFSQYGNLMQGGLNVRLSNIADRMREKAFIIDGHIVVWESFGWDEMSYFNDEKFLVFNSTVFAAAYEQQFQSIWNTSI